MLGFEARCGTKTYVQPPTLFIRCVNDRSLWRTAPSGAGGYYALRAPSHKEVKTTAPELNHRPA